MQSESTQLLSALVDIQPAKDDTIFDFSLFFSKSNRKLHISDIPNSVM